MTQAVLPTYNRTAFSIESGEGPWIKASDGRTMLDFGAGIAVNSLGHCHPHLVDTLKKQAEKLWHTSNLYRIPEGERLAERLCEATFADTVFFTNSGAEAMECSIKMARKYHAASGHPEKFRLITFQGAFHGRTLATIAAGGQQKYIDGFGPAVEGFDQVAFADHEAVEKAIGPETAGILIEPIQGEGGIRPVPANCLKGLRELCDKHGILLVFDEIQCGMGRTGKLFAHQHSSIVPDIMASAKGIGGGFPLGACLATSEAAKGMVAGSHGSTYGGNPMAMAIGNAVLDVMLEEGFLDHVSQMSLLLNQKLAGLTDEFPDMLSGVRGKGLMLGLECKVANTELQAACVANDLLVVAAGDNVVRLLPPLTITADDVSEAVARIEAACHQLRSSSASN
uniref:Acetylornithine aminotransferase n=1 Tax=uncultured bacterium fosmid I5J7 TaxID=1701911 RepID=A0A1B0THB2_9BACT|nr:acetylornithine aminotransferase [uncultured bacterium fosmid I5J7]